LKGLPKQRIVLHHALPNAMVPIIHGMAANLAYLIVGIVMVEAVFTFNGFGRLMVDAVGKHDIPVVQGCGLIFAILFIGLRLIADVLSILSNPRLRHAR
jgi:peptide/nickel transport system permease protein